MNEKLLPYPLPFGVRVKLMKLGCEVMLARFNHGEDSKEWNEARKVLDNHERFMRKSVGIKQEEV